MGKETLLVYNPKSGAGGAKELAKHLSIELSCSFINISELAVFLSNSNPSLETILVLGGDGSFLSVLRLLHSLSLNSVSVGLYGLGGENVCAYYLGDLRSSKGSFEATVSREIKPLSVTLDSEEDFFFWIASVGFSVKVLAIVEQLRAKGRSNLWRRYLAFLRGVKELNTNQLLVNGVYFLGADIITATFPFWSRRVRLPKPSLATLLTIGGGELLNKDPKAFYLSFILELFALKFGLYRSYGDIFQLRGLGFLDQLEIVAPTGLVALDSELRSARKLCFTGVEAEEGVRVLTVKD